MTDYAAIIERLEAADGMDRDLDKEIGFALQGWRYEEVGDHGQMIYVPDEQAYYADHPGSMYPSITEDISLAIELVEKLAQGAQWRLSGGGGIPYRGEVFLYGPEPGEDLIGRSSHAPIALLLGLMRPLKRRGDELYKEYERLVAERGY